MTAKYMRVANDVREQVSSGKLKPGDRIPTIAQLREKHEVSYSSVYGAMLVLKAEGLIEGRQGDGMFVK